MSELLEQDNIYLADKPLDRTSFDIVATFKRAFNLKKIGHSGTLDPRATGLLILCSGKKTKMINDFIDYDKEYNGIIRIGATTPTFDTESEEENIENGAVVTDSRMNHMEDGIEVNSNAVENHIANKLNPHSVTKNQVRLGKLLEH